jgi:hypothetical protein
MKGMERRIIGEQNEMERRLGRRLESVEWRLGSVEKRAEETMKKVNRLEQ